jgi:hypothetical protein
MDTAVSSKTGRQRGATKESIPCGSSTEEQRSRRPVFDETLRAEVFLALCFVALRSQIHGGYARSSLRAQNQKSSQRRCPEFFIGLLTADQLEILKHFKDRLGEVGRVTPCAPQSNVTNPAAPSSCDAGTTSSFPDRTPDSGFDLESLIIYRCVVGSRAYGLDTDDSDTDRRGIYRVWCNRNSFTFAARDFWLRQDASDAHTPGGSLRSEQRSLRQKDLPPGGLRRL